MSKKVFIGVGHGGSDPGAVANGLIEKDLNLEVAKIMREVLEESGVVVRMSRNTDVSESVGSRINESNSFNPDLTVDIHFNAGGGFGFEYWLYKENGLEKLGDSIGGLLEGGFGNRGMKKSSTLAFLKGTKNKAILLEGGFLDNSQNAKKLKDKDSMEEIGSIYAKMILDYLGIDYRVDELYRVQLGAFNVKSNADRLVTELKGKGYNAFVTQV